MDETGEVGGEGEGGEERSMDTLAMLGGAPRWIGLRRGGVLGDRREEDCVVFVQRKRVALLRSSGMCIVDTSCYKRGSRAQGGEV